MTKLTNEMVEELGLCYSQTYLLYQYAKDESFISGIKERLLLQQKIHKQLGVVYEYKKIIFDTDSKK